MFKENDNQIKLFIEEELEDEKQILSERKLVKRKKQNSYATDWF